MKNAYLQHVKRQAAYRREVEQMHQFDLSEEELKIQTLLRSLATQEGRVGPMKFKRVFGDLVAKRAVNYKQLRRRLPRALRKHTRKLVQGRRSTGTQQDFCDLALALADLMPIFVPNEVEDECVQKWLREKKARQEKREAHTAQDIRLIEKRLSKVEAQLAILQRGPENTQGGEHPTELAPGSSGE